MHVLIFLVCSSRPRVAGERGGEKASSRGRVVTLLSRLFLPCLRPLDIQGLKVVGARPVSRRPFRALDCLDNRYGFQGRVWSLLSYFRRLLGRISVGFHLTAKYGTVRGARVFLSRTLGGITVDLLLHGVRQVGVANVQGSFVRASCLLVVSLGSFLFSRSIGGNHEPSELFGRLFLYCFLWDVPSNCPAKRFRVLRWCRRLFEDA